MSSVQSSIFNQGLISDDVKFKIANNSESAGLGSLRFDNQRGDTDVNTTSGKDRDIHIQLVSPTTNIIGLTTSSIDLTGISQVDFYGEVAAGQSWDISVSADGENWFALRESGTAVLLTISTVGEFLQTFNFQARFIRLNYDSGSTGTGHVIWISGKSN